MPSTKRLTRKTRACLSSLFALLCSYAPRALADDTNTQLWEPPETVLSPVRPTESILEQARHAPITSAFFGRALDPREHAFSFISLGVSMGRRRGYGLFLSAQY
jgi:hypothetical protein